MANIGYQSPTPSFAKDGFQPSWLGGDPLKADDSGGDNDEGADPSEDIKKQNPGETSTPNIVEGEGGGDTKVQDLAKAGRKDFDPNIESPA